ncbi:STAS domain-containing protein [Frankia sp. Mgl5]|uniref:STAS domain-containing protein n=1 Tax=Frankia sp. Mgl5 TaxID=2933793 RepID=UPI00200EB4BF|nr:STAS domain-containing protein [Frankia sp. Mgl5]MCK9932329.1 STAS domain-containing protein [Frankia sp. Mgl5]
MEKFLDLSDPVREHPDGCATDFRTATCATPDSTVVRIYGEIDIATGAALRAALIAGLDRHPPILVIDLDGVSFLDAHGLGILVSAANQADRAGIPITVVGAGPHVYRLFTLTRLVERLDVHTTPTPITLTTRPGRGRRLHPVAISDTTSPRSAIGCPLGRSPDGMSQFFLGPRSTTQCYQGVLW